MKVISKYTKNGKKYENHVMDEYIIEKVRHLVENGYGCMMIDGHRVCYEETYEADGEKFIVVNVGDDGQEDEVDYQI